jgi:hypothetical protein
MTASDRHAVRERPRGACALAEGLDHGLCGPFLDARVQAGAVERAVGHQAVEVRVLARERAVCARARAHPIPARARC